MAVRLGVGDALVEQPGIQLLKVLEPQTRCEEPLADEPDLVLDLRLLPARCRRAGDRIDKVVTAHLKEAAIIEPLLADEDRLHRRLLVAAPRSYCSAGLPACAPRLPPGIPLPRSCLSPFDPTHNPPFGGSCLGEIVPRLGEEATAPARFGTEGAAERQRQHLITGLVASAKKAPKQLPAPNSDFYEVYETLNAEELATVKRVRSFMEAEVAPVITKYWVDDAFPFELLPAVKELGIGGLAMKGYGCAGGSLALLGFVQMEIARTNPSFATFIADAHAMGQPHRRWPFQVPVATSNPRSKKNEDSLAL
jgi:hypothetical protein